MKSLKTYKDIDFLLIDPQSEGSLAIYDYSLFSEVSLDNKGFVCNVKYDAPSVPSTFMFPYFDYLGKKSVSKGISYLISLIKIIILIYNCRPKVVHIQWYRLENVEFYLYKSLRHLLGFKLVYTAHNVLPHNSGNKKIKVYRKLYSLADAIIVHSKATVSELAEIGVDKKKIHVIKHGILQKREPQKKTPFDFRERYCIGKKILFSISGVQNAYKGTDLLIKAWTTTPLLYESNNCVLVIMGKNSGVDYSETDNVKNIIIIDRFFSDEEQEALFSATDVLLLPYRQISQSGVLLTALPYKIPLLVSNIGGLSETLDEANIGWRISPNNVKELATTLISIVQNPEVVNRIKNDQFEWDKILNYYSWNNIGNQTKLLYLDLIA